MRCWWLGLSYAYFIHFVLTRRQTWNMSAAHAKMTAIFHDQKKIYSSTIIASDGWGRRSSTKEFDDCLEVHSSLSTTTQYICHHYRMYDYLLSIWNVKCLLLNYNNNNRTTIMNNHTTKFYCALITFLILQENVKLYTKFITPLQ